MLFVDVVPLKAIGPALGDALLGLQVVVILGQLLGELHDVVWRRDVRGVHWAGLIHERLSFSLLRLNPR